MAGNLCRCGAYPKIEEAIRTWRRLIRTEKEVEGRFEDVWLLVEEDALEQWPAGPRDVVGRPAPRIDGHARARGEALFTADLRLPGHAPHGGAALAARARAGAADRPRAGARGARRPRRDRPGRRRRRSRASAATRARPVAAVCADTFAAGAARARADRGRVGRARAAARRGRGGRARRAPRHALERARRPRARPRRGGRRRRGDVPDADRAPQLHGDAPVGRAAGSATRSRSTPRRSTSGACARGSRRRSGSRRTACASSASTWAAASARRPTPGDYTLIAAELARRTGRPVRCALTRREENLAAGNRNATIQRLVAGARADGTLTALGGEFVNATGFGGWSSMTEGPMQMLYACPNVRTTTHAREAQPAADEGVPRARVRRGHVRARVPARRARGEARARPARAAPPQPRRGRPGRRQPLLRQGAPRVLPARRAALGAPRTRCARARPRP